MNGNAHIVVVDDEEGIRDLVQEYLLRHGYAVSTVDSGAALRALLAQRPADAVILDISMPGEDGLSIAHYLRRQGPVGIVMLTANRETIDRVVGLEVGADDYITKPFDLRELLARVRSVLRRATVAEPAFTVGSEIRFGRCLLDLAGSKLYATDGEEIPITAMEYDLLQVFARNPNRALSRERLLELCHAGEARAFDRSIDTRITRLRRKVESDPAKPSAIKTVRGIGYMFVPGPAGPPSAPA